MSLLKLTAALAFVALGCGAHGVKVGDEAACDVDAKLLGAAENSAGAPLPACATIGRNQLVNDRMESPAIASTSGCTVEFCQVNASQVPGWRTTSEAQVIEVWSNGYLDVPAAEGTQYIELDAQTADTLYQDIVLPPGELVYWSVLHRGRLGDESIEILLGPPESPVSRGLFESSNLEWQEHSGIYQVGTDEMVTRFSLASRTGTNEGNLVDRAVLAPIESAE